MDAAKIRPAKGRAMTGPARILPATDPAALENGGDAGPGELVAIPTETVHGLAGASTMADAIARIYAAKGRPSHNPLISHVSGIAMAERYVRFDDRARWPRPSGPGR